VNRFVLTPEEKRVVAFVISMILIGIYVQEYRKRHPPAPIPIEAQKHPRTRRKGPPSASVTPSTEQTAASTTPRPKRSRKPRKQSVTSAPTEEQRQSNHSAGISENQPPP